jgi:hypothetical protein
MRITKAAWLLVIPALFGLQMRAEELYQSGKGRSPRWASFENPTAAKGSAAQSNRSAKGHAFDSLKAGDSVALMEYAGSGVIRRMWITISDRSPEMLRSLTLAMYWDGAEKPAVLVPLGDFFSVSHGQMCAFESALFSNPEGRSFNCVIPMPFRRSARVVLRNESDQDLAHLFYDIDFEAVKGLPKDSLYFHCYWNRQLNTRLGEDFEILPVVKGRGRFLGVNVGVIANQAYEDSWWGEGEVKMYLDGDGAHPTLAGTGTEDYAGTAWGLGKFTQSYQGCPVANATNRMWSFYRFHIPDPIFFAKELKVTIQTIGGTGRDKMRGFLKKGLPVRPVSVDREGKLLRLLEPNAPEITDEGFPDGWVNFYREDDYCTTAYFYLDRAGGQLPSLPPVKDRTARLR